MKAEDKEQIEKTNKKAYDIELINMLFILVAWSLVIYATYKYYHRESKNVRPSSKIIQAAAKTNISFQAQK